MNLLKQLLTVVAFAYMCYHIYNFGPGMFNVTVLVVSYFCLRWLIISVRNVKATLRPTKMHARLALKLDMQKKHKKQ